MSKIGHLFISLMSFIFSFFVSSLYLLPSFFQILLVFLSVFSRSSLCIKEISGCGIIKTYIGSLPLVPDFELLNFWNVLDDRSGGAAFVIHKQVPFKQI